ncbi:hypothetical protein GJ744_009713 [Endocarpon pusillum]|uniref:FAR1 domain-containing protein n=1 Tax=Endocarpon pusillum TaxID=364733 RepID=A0A8H7AUQ2_9EURO|nr:hypothetical protein GJ744_003888 [Endocarpon pusillum]KAF7513292.1 hypothetical protein GJ744_009713 [Endocarpon pusillum]
MATLWQAHPLCPPEARNRLQDIVQGLPEAYLLPPQTGEEFENPESCLRRLQGYALSKGFAVIKVSGSTDSKRVRIQYRCIHHGKQTQNNRRLELHVERDSEGRTITQRQRESTHTQQMNCPWSVYLSLRKIRGTSQTALLLGITHLEHNHPMAINPLQYRPHLRLDEEHSKALKMASAHRASYLGYTTSQRILNKEGLSLSRTDYYNLHREQKAGEVHHEFEALIWALDKAGFRYACRADNVFNEAGELVSRQIQQIWFALD